MSAGGCLVLWQRGLLVGALAEGSVGWCSGRGVCSLYRGAPLRHSINNQVAICFSDWFYLSNCIQRHLDAQTPLGNQKLTETFCSGSARLKETDCSTDVLKINNCSGYLLLKSLDKTVYYNFSTVSVDKNPKYFK